MMLALSITIALLIVSIGINIFLAFGVYAAYDRILKYEQKHGVKI